jgi:signal transduction histidine kinase
VEDPASYGYHHSHWHSRRVARWQRRWSRGPLRRDPQDRLAGGVASGLAFWRGFSPTTVRIVLVLITIVTQGTGIALYVLAWLLIPAQGEDQSIASRARNDSRGIALAAALASLLTVILLPTGVLNDGWLASWAWPQVISVAGLTLIWRNAPPDEKETMRRLVEPLESFGTGGSRHRPATIVRLALAAIAMLVGVIWLSTAHTTGATLKQFSGIVLLLAGIVLLLGPWWFRIARDLVVERQARARAEERADMATRVHDSVLQTLALIQRHADDPQQVVQLARAQERELRSWLFEGRPPGSLDEQDTTVAAGVRRIQQEVEARHGVPVEAVTVGDCDLDDNLAALLAAGREATVNAAKWSGASVISLFAEVEPEEVSLVVRDRGQGFDPGAVPGDRKGLSESVRGRISRHGGEATITSAPGEGTKVSLTMPRAAQASRA